MDVVSRQEEDSFIDVQRSEALVCGYTAVQGRRLCDAINLCIFRVNFCICFFDPRSYDCIHVDNNNNDQYTTKDTNNSHQTLCV